MNKFAFLLEMDIFNFFKLKKYVALYFRISKLLDDKFCIYSPYETRIYQFNNKDFTITLLKRINVNLKNLIEIENDIYINIVDNYFYVWKKLKSIYKWNSIIFIILVMILNSFVRYFFQSLGQIFIYAIIFIQTIIIFLLLRLNIHLLNPYKRIKNGLVYHLEKCGKNICCLISREYIGIYDYKNYKIIKKINFDNTRPYFLTFFIVNENIIVFVDITNKNTKIYDIYLNKMQHFYFFNQFHNKI